MMRTKSAVIWVCNGACMLHGVCCTLTDFGCKTGMNVRRSDGLTCSGGDSSESGIWSSMRRRTNYARQNKPKRRYRNMAGRRRRDGRLGTDGGGIGGTAKRCYNILQLSVRLQTTSTCV